MQRPGAIPLPAFAMMEMLTSYFDLKKSVQARTPLGMTDS